jgi:hypothetical protein
MRTPGDIALEYKRLLAVRRKYKERLKTGFLAGKIEALEWVLELKRSTDAT